MTDRHRYPKDGVGAQAAFVLRAVKLEHSLEDPKDGRPAAVYGDYEADGSTTRLVMSLTMMNESGLALDALGFPQRDLLVVCDDANLPLGTLRMRPSP